MSKEPPNDTELFVKHGFSAFAVEMSATKKTAAEFNINII